MSPSTQVTRGHLRQKLGKFPKAGTTHFFWNQQFNDIIRKPVNPNISLTVRQKHTILNIILIGIFTFAQQRIYFFVYQWVVDDVINYIFVTVCFTNQVDLSTGLLLIKFIIDYTYHIFIIQSGNIQSSAHTTDASRDNRLHAQAIRQKQGNTITGKGGARVRIPNQDFLLNDLQNLQNGIEELMGK